MDNVGAFSESDANKLAAFYGLFSRQPLNRERLLSLTDLPSCGIEFRNDSGEAVPAYGILAATGQATRGSSSDPSTWSDLVTIDKPGTTLASLYLVNGPATVAAGRCGLAQAEAPFRVLHDGLVTPTYGLAFGPRQGQWSGSAGYPALSIAHGPHHAADNTLTGTFDGVIKSLIGKPTGAISSSMSGTVYIWIGVGGSESQSSGPMQITAWNRTSVTIPTTKFVKCTLINGVWYAEPWEC